MSLGIRELADKSLKQFNKELKNRQATAYIWIKDIKAEDKFKEIF